MSKRTEHYITMTFVTIGAVIVFVLFLALFGSLWYDVLHSGEDAGLYQAQCGMLSFTFEREFDGGEPVDPETGNFIHLGDDCTYQLVD